MKALSVVFGILAVLLSDLMCAVAAYRYCDMLWGIRYAGFSAPVDRALVCHPLRAWRPCLRYPGAFLPKAGETELKRSSKKPYR